MQLISRNSKLVVEPKESYVTFNGTNVVVAEKTKVRRFLLFKRPAFICMINLEPGLWISSVYLPDGTLFSVLGRKQKSQELNLKRRLAPALKLST